MRSRLWLLNGPRLVAERLKLGILQVEFARRAGWSAPYQCRLENGNNGKVVIQSTKNIIDAVLVEGA